MQLRSGFELSRAFWTQELGQTGGRRELRKTCKQGRMRERASDAKFCGSRPARDRQAGSCLAGGARSDRLGREVATPCSTCIAPLCTGSSSVSSRNVSKHSQRSATATPSNCARRYSPMCWIIARTTRQPQAVRSNASWLSASASECQPTQPRTRCSRAEPEDPAARKKAENGPGDCVGIPWTGRWSAAVER